MELDTSRSCDLVDLSGAGAPDNLRKTLDAIAAPVHFIGIGGIGMSALARLMLAKGCSISGSDKAESPITRELQDLGARIYIGHRAENVADAGAIVVSTAITSENPERAAAEKKNIPVFHRSEVLAWLASDCDAVAVSGTHGKTTTTGMIAQVLIDGGLEPSVVVGGIFPRLKSNARVGTGRYFVAEADESDRTHATMRSHISVVTNIEPDHLENYPGGMKQILEVMASFVNLSRNCTVVCQDDSGCRELLPLLKVPVVTYGQRSVSPDAKYSMEVLESGAFVVYVKGKPVGEVKLGVPGLHNKLNALAAIAVGFECGVDFETMRVSMETFGGVERRFQILGTVDGITVVDDYGHHPTEVRATLEAAKQFLRSNKINGRVVALFQPHQPGRLRDLWTEFCEAFEKADLVLLTDVYVARGGQIEGINSERFAKEVVHKNVKYLSGPVTDLAAKVAPLLMPGDVVLTIGAGDITGVGQPIITLLESTRQHGRNAQ